MVMRLDTWVITHPNTILESDHPTKNQLAMRIVVSYSYTRS